MKIRQGFVSNSSSSSFIVIPKYDPDKYVSSDDVLKILEQEMPDMLVEFCKDLRLGDHDAKLLVELEAYLFEITSSERTKRHEYWESICKMRYQDFVIFPEEQEL